MSGVKTATCHPGRKHIARGLCKLCYDKDYDAKNREKRNARSREWAANNKGKRLAIRRKYLYGIDQASVDARLKAQDGLCKICLVAPAKHLDHDHKTGIVRSVLCGKCNRAIGLLEEDVARIRRAAAYLELWMPAKEAA